MLIVNKSANTELVVTLTENMDTTYPYFLWEFKSDVSGEVKRFICQDSSTQAQRYNLCLITETSGTENLTSGTITLNPTGQWTYKVYGQNSSTNLNPTLANTDVLEIGRVRVIGTETTYDTNSTTSTTFDVYEPQ